MDKIKPLLIVMFLLIVLTPLVSSASILIEPFTYKAGSQINLTVGCSELNCADGDINISVIRDGYLELDDQTAIKKNGYAYYPFFTNTTGEYLVYWTTANDDYEEGFEVTQLGDYLTDGKALIYLSLLFFVLCILGTLVYGAIKVEWKTPKDIDGVAIGVNHGKTWKVVLFILVYFVTLWIFAILRALSSYYTDLEGLTNLFYWVYSILLAFALPALITGVIIGVVVWIRNMKIEKKIEQNRLFG